VAGGNQRQPRMNTEYADERQAKNKRGFSADANKEV
jgi:hypothetical protein